MATKTKRNELQLLTGYTLRRLRADERVLWWHKFEAQIRGPKFRTPAPIDYLLVLPSGETIYVECKQCGKRSLPPGSNPDQRSILRRVPTAFLLVRFYAADMRKNSGEYWEEIWLLHGSRVTAEDKGNNITVEQLRKLEAEGGPARLVAQMRAGTARGVDDSYGRNEKGKAVVGLSEFPLDWLERQARASRVLAALCGKGNA